MSELRARVSYLQGLAEGMNLSQSNEGKLLSGVIDVLNDFANSFSQIEETQEEIEEYLETVDEDLFNLEEDYYGDDYFVDDDYWDEGEDALTGEKSEGNVVYNYNRGENTGQKTV